MYISYGASLVVHSVKSLPATWETWVWSLGREDLEKGMATHSSILAWRNPWTKEPGRLQSMGLQRVRHNWVTNIFIYHICLCTWIYVHLNAPQQSDVLDKAGRRKWCTYLCLSCFCDGRYIKELSSIKMQTTEKDHCNRVTFILNYVKDIL